MHPSNSKCLIIIFWTFVTYPVRRILLHPKYDNKIPKVLLHTHIRLLYTIKQDPNDNMTPDIHISQLQ